MRTGRYDTIGHTRRVVLWACDGDGVFIRVMRPNDTLHLRAGCKERGCPRKTVMPARLSATAGSRRIRA